MSIIYRVLLLFIAHPMAYTVATAQTCGGNLGENIFAAGDFGSGTDNIVGTNPGIAPGFSYQPFPPPNDGFYTITNDMSRWGSIFSAWQQISDNSSDPNGYMMVVNASFQPGLFYEQEVTGLCENTVYQFSADVFNIIRPGENVIKPNLSFLINEEARFSSGDVPEDGVWHTYGFTFSTGPTETTVTLSLRNNAPGGNGNDLALDNISFRACGPEARVEGPEAIKVCEDGGPTSISVDITGDEYASPAVQWQQSFDGGISWQNIPGENGNTLQHDNRASGFYYYRYLLANGVENLTNGKCRVVSNEKLIEVVPKRYGLLDTLCAGLQFTVGNSTYGRSGTFVDTLRSSLGCDSIVTLELTILEDPGLVAQFELNDPSCSYLSDGGVELLGVTNGSAPLDYRFGDSSTVTNATVLGLAEGVYPYAVTDRYGCNVEGEVELRSPNPFQVELGDDLVLELGDAYRFAVASDQEIGTYTISPPDFLDCTEDCEGEVVYPIRSTTLSVLATSPAGCEASDSLRIILVKVRNVYVPNAFTPNGDGVNDRFTLFGEVPAVTRILQLRLFNRWGTEVFAGENLEPNDSRTGWDGNVNDRPAPSGTYFYAARVEFLDGAVEEYSGGVTLMR